MTDGLEGFDEFKQSLNNMFNNMDDVVDKRLGALLDEVVADTQLTTPVDTGNLRRSWTRGNISKESNSYSGEVGTNVDYAEPVEFGHLTRNGGFVKGQFMLTNAVKRAEKKLPEIGEEILNEIIKGAGL